MPSAITTTTGEAGKQKSGFYGFIRPPLASFLSPATEILHIMNKNRASFAQRKSTLRCNLLLLY